MLSNLIRSASTSIRRILGRSDLRTWSDLENLSDDWHERTRRLASIIEPDSAVIEFGAGRFALADMLPEGCTYTPSDIVDRGKGTIVCDLNASTLPNFGSHDVAVFSGVLEYVHDVPRLISHLARSVDVIITSYAAVDRNRKRNRRALGWVNDYTDSQFTKIFAAANFRKTGTDQWNSQVIYRFQRHGKIDCR